jgi:hypothetical protein
MRGQHRREKGRGIWAAYPSSMPQPGQCQGRASAQGRVGSGAVSRPLRLIVRMTGIVST